VLRLPDRPGRTRADPQARPELELSEDGDAARLVYTDDPELRPLIGAWLDRTEMRDAQERVKLRAHVEQSKDVPITGQTAAGDISRLRGLPAIGRGVGGAVPGTDPLRALLKKERRAADRELG